MVIDCVDCDVSLRPECLSSGCIIWVFNDAAFLISFFFFPFYEIVKVELRALVMEIIGFLAFFLSSSFFNTSEINSNNMLLSALTAKVCWHNSKRWCVLQVQVRMSLFPVDGVTINGWIPLLLFTVCVLLSDDAATVIAPVSSNNFLEFSKISETISDGMLKRSVRWKSPGTKGSLLCRPLSSFSNSVDVFFRYMKRFWCGGFWRFYNVWIKFLRCNLSQM